MIEELLPFAIFIIYVIGKIIHGLDENADKNKNQSPVPSQPQPRKTASKSQSKIDAKNKIEQKSKDLKSDTFSHKSNKTLVKDRLDGNNKKSNRISPIKRNSIVQKDRVSVNLNLNNEQELLKGIIYKEVLDKPRAKKSYLPPYLR